MNNPLDIISRATLDKDKRFAATNPIFRSFNEGFFDCLRETVGGLEFGSMLEVGCGEGATLMVLEDLCAGREVCGVDEDDAKLALCKVNAPFAKLTLGGATSLPFADASFDLVIACGVLERQKDPEKALLELKRVGGRFVFSVPCKPPFFSAGLKVRLRD